MQCLLGQQAVDLLQIFRRQRPTCLAQTQVAQQQVVTRLRQIAFGLEQLALRIQHVDVDAHAELVAQLVGVRRALAR
jgi:hypothetical protein